MRALVERGQEDGGEEEPPGPPEGAEVRDARGELGPVAQDRPAREDDEGGVERRETPGPDEAQGGFEGGEEAVGVEERQAQIERALFRTGRSLLPVARGPHLTGLEEQRADGGGALVSGVPVEDLLEAAQRLLEAARVQERDRLVEGVSLREVAACAVDVGWDGIVGAAEAETALFERGDHLAAERGRVHGQAGPVRREQPPLREGVEEVLDLLEAVFLTELGREPDLDVER